MARKGGRSKMTAAEKAARALAEAKPNPRVVARQDRFRHFHGNSSIGHEMTSAGRLMLVGGFDGLDLAPEALLSALIDYSFAYWGQYHGGPQMSDYQREVHARPVSNDIEQDGRGERFEAMDRLLCSHGHQVRNAVHDITVDAHWFPDTDAEWVERIINTRITQKREQWTRRGQEPPPELWVAGHLSVDSDWAMLDLARHGAMALAIGNERKKAA